MNEERELLREIVSLVPLRLLLGGAPLPNPLLLPPFMVVCSCYYMYLSSLHLLDYFTTRDAEKYPVKSQEIPEEIPETPYVGTSTNSMQSTCST